MTVREMVEQLAPRWGLSKKNTTKLLHELRDFLIEHISVGDEIPIYGIGTFKPYQLKNGRVVTKFRPTRRFFYAARLWK